MFHVIELETNGFDFLNKENPHLIRQFDVIIHGREGGYTGLLFPWLRSFFAVENKLR